jgi:predicted small integral membrane protein
METYLKYPVMRLAVNVATIIAYISIPIRTLIINLYILVLYLVSAGPIGNPRTNTLPPRGKQHRRPCAIIFYMLQFLLALPGLIVFHAPTFLMIWAVGSRLWYGADEKWSDFRFIPMGLIAIDVQDG